MRILLFADGKHKFAVLKRMFSDWKHKFPRRKHRIVFVEESSLPWSAKQSYGAKTKNL